MDIIFRPRNKNDQQFVFELFYAHKVKELQAERWPEEMRLKLCKIQLENFEKTILANYYNLEDQIISIESLAIGRLLINKTDGELNLIYLALLPEYQNKGIGKKILYILINEANQSMKNICLKVSKENPAFHLYEKLGFVVIDEDEIRYSMMYSPLLKTKTSVSL